MLSLLFKWAMLAGYSSRLLLNFGLAFFIPDNRLQGILQIISKFPEFLSLQQLLQLCTEAFEGTRLMRTT